MMGDPSLKWFRGATDPNERRIILVGKTGVGKSAAGNTILGSKAFFSKMSSSSVTSECQKAKGLVGDRNVAVVDTPGLFDTKLTKDEVLKRIKMCICLSAPGPHAFLIVLKLDRFTEEEKETVKMIQKTFGEEAAKYTMVLFTHGDQLEGQTIESYISENPDLKAFIQQCNNRYHVFNNKVKDPEQTRQLLVKIDQMIGAKSYYTNEMFRRAEEAIQEEKQRLLKEMEAQMQRQLYKPKANWDELYKIFENEAREQAERFNRLVVGASAAYGAFMGGLIGAVGGPGGVLFGAAAGAALSVRISERCHVQ